MRRKSNQVLLRGNRTSPKICPKYLWLLVDEDEVSYLTDEFQKRTGHEKTSFSSLPLSCDPTNYRVQAFSSLIPNPMV